MRRPRSRRRPRRTCSRRCGRASSASRADGRGAASPGAVATASRLLREDGRAAAGPMLERLAETLRAAASVDEARDALERGVVTREYERSGFGGLTGLIPEGVNRPGAAGGAPARD